MLVGSSAGWASRPLHAAVNTRTATRCRMFIGYPTGAGDAFRGGLIKGLVLKCPMERAVQMGTVCGHYAIQKAGTQEYSFTMEQFNAKLEEHFGT